MAPKTHTQRLDQFLAAYSPAYGDTWDGAVTYLTTHPTESTTVERLRQVYRRDGEFHTPIRVDDGVVLNGMHRITALILENAAEITFTRDDPYPAPDLYVELQMNIAGAINDLVYDALRSFPLDPHSDRWVEGWLGSTNGVVHATYGIPNGAVEALLARIPEELALIDVQATMTEVTVRTRAEYDAWLEAELADR